MSITIQNERGVTYGTTVSMVTEICFNCHMPFSMPSEFQTRMLDKRGHETGMFYCPQGHRQRYLGQTEVQKLMREKEQLEREVKVALDSRDYHKGKFEDANRSLIATRGVVTRKRRELHRVSKGVCPCCNRTFENLARHMSGKHPEFSKGR